MNERIRELLEQAGVNYAVMPKDTVYEKFAELLVKECMEWCDAHATINGTAQQVRNSIKNHFGVEE
jgi:hypothetical protein